MLRRPRVPSLRQSWWEQAIPIGTAEGIVQAAATIITNPSLQVWDIASLAAAETFQMLARLCSLGFAMTALVNCFCFVHVQAHSCEPRMFVC